MNHALCSPALGTAAEPSSDRPSRSVKDRMDITAARRGLAGAEAILKPRAIKANRDFEEYWRYHLAQEHHHIHQAGWRHCCSVAK